jgi:cytochrome c oxidase subunit 2
MRNHRHTLSIVGAILCVIAAPALACRTTGSTAPEQTSGPSEQLLHITAQRFEYSPAEVHVKRGVPVVLELTSLDRMHGFDVPDLNLRSDVPPGVITRVRFVPEHSGRFEFHCDVFCGGGHEDMTGEIVVED